MKKLKIKTKIIVVITACMIVLLLFAPIYDWHRVTSHRKGPSFTSCRMTADDGGSGDYKGFGYHIDVRGNLEINSSFTVERASFYLFGELIGQFDAVLKNS